MSRQLERFLELLPSRPYCSDDLSAGLRIRPRDEAIGRRYIQHNSPAAVSYLVFDVDRGEESAYAWDRAGLPPPTWGAVNPKSGNAHLAYALRTPVARTDAARMKPLEYLAAIERAFVHELGADRGYAKVVTKNPFSPSWRVFENPGAVYDLGQLAEHVDLTKPRPAPREVSGLGRNCALFDALRHEAYGAVCRWRETSTYDAWFSHLLTRASHLNNFRDPLPVSELRSIAKSIARWTWKNFGTGAAAEAFSKRQKARQGRSARARKGNTAARVIGAVAAARAAGEAITVSHIARALGLTRVTVRKHAHLFDKVLLEAPAHA